MKKLLYIFLFLPVFAPAQVQMFFTSDSSAFITSPLDADSLSYWFDASQGVFDSVGSVISNNQGVGEWKDLSGRGHHVLQTTDGARPQYQATGGPNNYPALYFDGTNDIMTSASHFWESDDLTIFCVVKFENATRNVIEPIFSFNNGAQGQLAWHGRNLANSYHHWLLKFSSGTNRVDERNGAKEAAWRSLTWVSPTSTASFFKDGVSQTVTRVVTGSGDGTVADNTGQLIIASNIPAGTIFLQGWMSEFIVYSRALTTAEREGIEAYLNHKYKIY